MEISISELEERAADVLEACRALGFHMVTAESCTGGLIAACLTAIPGSSEVLERGFVTYSNTAKMENLGVADTLLESMGAVSEEVVIAMAEGALRSSHADVSIAVSGVAGPGGGTSSKPVGLVHIASACRGRNTLHEEYIFPGGRQDVRFQTVEAALALITKQLP